MAQTGQSEPIHRRRMRQHRREVDQAGSQVNRGGLHRRDLLLAQGLRAVSDPLERGT